MSAQLRTEWRDIKSSALEKCVWTFPATTLAKAFGVSGSAIKRKCNRRGIMTPPPGYWAKVKAGILCPPSGAPTVCECPNYKRFRK